MHWGHKLTLVFIVFAGWMGYLAYRASHVNIDLVQDDYYKTELKYQEVIDANKRSTELSSPVLLSENSKYVNIQFPREMKNTDVNGTAWFYCASDAGKDRQISIKVSPDALQQIDVKNFKPGSYVVKLSWSSNSKSYYAEEPFTIL